MKTKSKTTGKSLKNLKPGEFCWLERGMFARKTTTGVHYGISYMHDGRRVMETVGASKTAARKALAVRKAEVAQGRYQLATKRKYPTVMEFCERYLTYAREHKRSWKRDAGVMRCFKDFFGSKRIDKLAALDFERYKAERVKSVSRASVNRELAVAKRMFSLAVEWGVLGSNPVAAVKPYREAERNFRALTPEECEQLIDGCNVKLQPFVVVALNTGLRRGEMFRLQWSHVNLPGGSLTVAESKSGKVRKVPLNAAARGALQALPPPRKGYVFPGRGGAMRDNVRKAWDSACKRAGIQSVTLHPETGTRQVWPRVHDLRHTFATNLVLGGVDLVTVKELMGHADISTTLRYAHPTPESKRNAVNSLCESATKVQHFAKTPPVVDDVSA